MKGGRTRDGTKASGGGEKKKKRDEKACQGIIRTVKGDSDMGSFKIYTHKLCAEVSGQ